jgi:hypothetical protein
LIFACSDTVTLLAVQAVSQYLRLSFASPTASQSLRED